MKNKFNILLSIAGLLAFTATHAQIPTMTSSSVSTEIEGTPYLDDNFVQGIVYHDNTSHKVALRYNANKDVMEYMEGQMNMSLEPGPKISKVIVGATTYVIRKFDYKKKSRWGYLTVLDSGKVTLYAKKVISFHQARKGTAPDFRDRLAGYDRESDIYYYQVGDGELHELESIKSMIATLPEQQEELAQFAKKEKISASKEQKVVKFVHYINTLGNESQN